MTLTILPPALNEAIEAADYYDSQRPGLGREFEDHFRAGAILSRPHSWARQIEDYRRYRLHRFPYGIVYRVRGEEIIVVAVMHLHRRPLYWRHGLKPE